METAWILAFGLGLGLLASLVALVPHWSQAFPWRGMLYTALAVACVGGLSAVGAAWRLRKALLISELRRE